MGNSNLQFQEKRSFDGNISEIIGLMFTMLTSFALYNGY
jgi:hypothetical protein